MTDYHSFQTQILHFSGEKYNKKDRLHGQSVPEWYGFTACLAQKDCWQTPGICDKIYINVRAATDETAAD